MLLDTVAAYVEARWLQWVKDEDEAREKGIPLYERYKMPSHDDGSCVQTSFVESPDLVAIDTDKLLPLLDTLPPHDQQRTPVRLPSKELWIEWSGGIRNPFFPDDTVLRQGLMVVGRQYENRWKPGDPYGFSVSVWSDYGEAWAKQMKPNQTYALSRHFNLSWRMVGYFVTDDPATGQLRAAADPPAGIHHDWTPPELPPAEEYRPVDAVLLKRLAGVLGLLACKNVVTQPTATYTPRLPRTRKPLPSIEVKTLKLTVPATVVKRGPGGTADPDCKTRFHLCRGHFKNLTHPRYKNPGLHWWPAHWRGDADTGVVVKDYQLQPATEPFHLNTSVE